MSERLQAPHVIIENLDFRDILKRYDAKETFFYLDPPYEGTEAPYPGTWTHQDTEDLVAALDKLKGKFLLSWGGPVKLKFKRKVWVKEFRSTHTLSKQKSRLERVELAIANYRLRE